MTHELIFIGDTFYIQSQTDMGSLYEILGSGAWERWDWGFVSRSLARGETINIRPATDAELGKAWRMLQDVQEVPE